jgi:hypothetical protein
MGVNVGENRRQRWERLVGKKEGRKCNVKACREGR